MKHPWFCYLCEKGVFWFRIFGYGIHCIDRSMYEPGLGERLGFWKVLKIRKWSIRWLTP